MVEHGVLIADDDGRNMQLLPVHYLRNERSKSVIYSSYKVLLDTLLRNDPSFILLSEDLFQQLSQKVIQKIISLAEQSLFEVSLKMASINKLAGNFF